MLLYSLLSLKSHRNVSKSSPLLLRSSMLHTKQIIQYLTGDLNFTFFLSDTAGDGGGVVCNEPVVDVEGDEEGGKARDGDDVQNPWMVDQEKQPILTFEMFIDFLKECKLE